MAQIGPPIEGRARGLPQPVVHWTNQQDEEDYRAAEAYLQFLYTPAEARDIVDRMRVAPVVYHYSADVRRLSGQVLDLTDLHVVRIFDEFHKGRLLSPLLMVRGAGGSKIAFCIADGYYRLSASFHIDELAKIPCRIVDKPAK